MKKQHDHGATQEDRWVKMLEKCRATVSSPGCDGAEGFVESLRRGNPPNRRTHRVEGASIVAMPLACKLLIGGASFEVNGH